MKNNKGVYPETFINDVFQSGLDQTFQVEKSPPVKRAAADEINQAVAIVKASADFKPNTRFALAEPKRPKSGTFVLNGTAVDAPRQANIIMLDGKHIIESRVDLKEKKDPPLEADQDAHGMVLLDDFNTVQQIINESPEFAAVLIKRGITDPKKVITTPLPSAFFDGKVGWNRRPPAESDPAISTWATVTTGRTRSKTWLRWWISSRRKSRRLRKARSCRFLVHAAPL